MGLFFTWLVLVAITLVIGFTANLIWRDDDSEMVMRACLLAPITTVIGAGVLFRAICLRICHTLKFGKFY